MYVVHIQQLLARLADGSYSLRPLVILFVIGWKKGYFLFVALTLALHVSVSPGRATCSAVLCQVSH